ncbi:MAG TPA: RsmD family RNA methyltransferase [Verrucomicrobiae bacterium]|nr:RsmD family RNA methyltransferase [Verrucomicrobiae bacterium]
MRITGGHAGGRILKVPKGMAVRPTPDLVKQAVFNSLGERVIGARVLELFAGSGALSLECLSRGAKSALCVELSPKHADFIRRNAASSREITSGGGQNAMERSISRGEPELPPRSLEVRTQDVFAVIPQLIAVGQQFDLILADPPYGEKNVGRRSTSLAQKLIDVPELPRLLAPGGRFVLGHARRDTLEIPKWWGEAKVMKHGDNMMRFLETR